MKEIFFFLKKVKFKDVCMAGWQLPATQRAVNVVNLKASFEIGFQTFSFKFRMLTKCYMLFLVIVFVYQMNFNFQEGKQ